MINDDYFNLHIKNKTREQLDAFLSNTEIIAKLGIEAITGYRAMWVVQNEPQKTEPTATALVQKVTETKKFFKKK